MLLAKAGLLGILSILLVEAGLAQDRTVVLGGAGPSPYFEQALDKIADSLAPAGVKAKIFSGNARTRNALLDEAKNQGYANLLYVTLSSPRDGRADAARGNVVAACFVDGTKTWEEKSNSPLLLPLSKEHEVESMINGIVKKIGKRGMCLPK
jgi:hypothetical protein